MRGSGGLTPALALLLAACAAAPPALLPLALAPGGAPEATEAAGAGPGPEAPASAGAGAALVASAASVEAQVEAPPAEEKPGACAPPDRGWGRYLPYQKIPGARVSLPELGEGAPQVFDVLVHFHASEAARRGFVHEGYPAIFVGVDLGEGSGAYRRAFDEPEKFTKMLRRVGELLREHAGPKARLGDITLSSWSAGFGATTRLLKLFPEKIRAMIFLDSLYAPFQKDEQGEDIKGEVFAPAVAPVLGFARQAQQGKRGLYLSYSNIPTQGYASTGAVAMHLLGRLARRELAVTPGVDPRGQVAALDRGGLHLRGFRGSDARAHCNHLKLMGEAVKRVRAQKENAGGQE